MKLVIAPQAWEDLAHLDYQSEETQGEGTPISSTELVGTTTWTHQSSHRMEEDSNSWLTWLTSSEGLRNDCSRGVGRPRVNPEVAWTSQNPADQMPLVSWSLSQQFAVGSLCASLALASSMLVILKLYVVQSKPAFVVKTGMRVYILTNWLILLLVLQLMKCNFTNTRNQLYAGL